jgi:hypothetical protein
MIKKQTSPKARTTKTAKKSLVPSATIELITPEIAKQYLKMNTMNRKINQASVNRIAQSMTNGKFVLTSSGIGFDRNNVMTDGQKRCTSVIKSGVPVWMVVVRNLDPIARVVCDTNDVRTPAHSIQMLGLGAVEEKVRGKETRKDYSKLLASVSAYIILHQTNRFGYIQSFGKHVTNDEITAFVNKNYDELMESVQYVSNMVKDRKYVQTSHLFFVYQMHKFFNKKRITQFINIVCNNEMSENPATCPATKLRDTLQANAIKKGVKFGTKDLISLMIEASNKFMNNIDMKPNRKLSGRPNGSNLINVQFSGDLNEKAIKFFNSVEHDKKVIA